MHKNHMNGSGGMSDKEARAAGFKSAAEMQAFYANRARMRKRGGDKPGVKTTPRAEDEDRSLLGRIFRPVNEALNRGK